MARCEACSVHVNLNNSVLILVRVLAIIKTIFRHDTVVISYFLVIMEMLMQYGSLKYRKVVIYTLLFKINEYFDSARTH